jgi:hypothetical protein
MMERNDEILMTKSEMNPNWRDPNLSEAESDWRRPPVINDSAERQVARRFPSRGIAVSDFHLGISLGFRHSDFGFA